VNGPVERISDLSAQPAAILRILKAMAKKNQRLDAAEIIGVCGFTGRCI
jgi:hypothetical protein